LTTRPAPLLNLNLRWFLLAMILANIAGQMVYSMLSLYLVELGASVGQVGLVFTLASLVPIALQILGGWFSDTAGRLRAIALGSAISVFGYVLFFFAPSWQWVMLGLAVEFISGSFVAPSFSAYIAEQAPEAQRGRVFGLTSSIYMIVMVIGPALAGLLAYRFSFRWMFFVALAAYASATVVRVWMATAERFAPPARPAKPGWGSLASQLRIIFALLVGGGLLTWIWMADAVGDMSFNLIGQLYPIYLSEVGRLNLEQIGLLNAAWGAATIAASALAGWLTDRRSAREVAAGGFLLEALGLGLLLLGGGLPALLLAMIVFGLGAGSLMPAFQTLITKAVPEERRGLAFGFFGTSLGLLSLPFPWIGAQLWERIAPPAPFWVAAAACLVSIPIAWYKFIPPQTTEETR
jgi:MFS family permease